MTEPTHLASDQSDTPRTDAAAFTARERYCVYPGTDEMVPADFARAQERTIAELAGALKALRKVVSDAVDAWDDDNDSRVGKIIHALDGRVPRYREDTDLIVAAIQKAKQL